MCVLEAGVGDILVEVLLSDSGGWGVDAVGALGGVALGDPRHFQLNHLHLWRTQGRETSHVGRDARRHLQAKILANKAVL